MRTLACIIALGIVSLIDSSAHAEASYKFTVVNKTSTKIVKLLTQLDGEKWQPFDLGDGIPGNSSTVIEWSEQTDDSACSLPLKAVYADKSESEVKKYDFCEKNLEINFTE